MANGYERNGERDRQWAWYEPKDTRVDTVVTYSFNMRGRLCSTHYAIECPVCDGLTSLIYRDPIDAPQSAPPLAVTASCDCAYYSYMHVTDGLHTEVFRDEYTFSSLKFRDYNKRQHKARKSAIRQMRERLHYAEWLNVSSYAWSLLGDKSLADPDLVADHSLLDLLVKEVSGRENTQWPVFRAIDEEINKYAQARSGQKGSRFRTPKQIVDRFLTEWGNIQGLCEVKPRRLPVGYGTDE